MKNIIKKGVAIAALALTTMFVVGPTIAHAEDGPPPPVNVDTVSSAATVAIAAPIVTLIVSAIIPLLVGLLTKSSWSSNVKAIIMIVLNAISAFVMTSTLDDGTAMFSSTAFWTWLVGVIVSAVAYVVGYVPNNLTSRPGGKLATKGIH